MIRGKFRKGVLGMLGIALAAAFAVTGCSGTTLNSQTGWTLVGKVVDANSRAGVAGARVCVKINGDWNKYCAKTSAGTTGSITPNAAAKFSAGDTKGDYVITGLPYLAANTPVIVQGPAGGSYVSITTAVNFTAGAAQNAAAGAANGQWDMGQVAIDTGITVTIFVVDSGTGKYVTTNGAPIYIGMGGTGDVNDYLATYVSGGQYTITVARNSVSSQSLINQGTSVGVAQFGTLLTIPPFKTSTGVWYTAGSTLAAWSDIANETTAVVNLPVSAVSSTTALQAVASNFTSRIDNSAVGATGAGINGKITFGLLAATAKADGIQLFLNLPVTLVKPTAATGTAVDNPYNYGVTYVDHFKVLTGAAATVLIPAVASIDATNTALLMLKPASDLVDNQTYQLFGRVQAAGPGANQPGTNGLSTVALDTIPLIVANAGTTPTAISSFYVPSVLATGNGSISKNPVIQVDNQNGYTAYAAGVLGATSALIVSTDTNVTQANPKKPWLMFPEMVWGTVRLINYPGMQVIFPAAGKTLAGTINYNAATLNSARGGVVVNGIGTSFTTDLQIGDNVTDSNGVVWSVAQIYNNLSMLATCNIATNVTAAATGIITARDGYYLQGSASSKIVLTGSNRVGSAFVNDAAVTNVLAAQTSANPYTITSISNTTPASSGLGSGLTINLAGGTRVLTGATVAGGGRGYIAGDLVQVNGGYRGAGATINLAAAATTVTVGATVSSGGQGYVVGDVLTVLGGTTNGSITLAQVTGTGNTGSILTADIAASGVGMVAGAGYTASATSLATVTTSGAQLPDGVLTITTVNDTGTNMGVVTVVTATAQLGNYKQGAVGLTTQHLGSHVTNVTYPTATGLTITTPAAAVTVGDLCAAAPAANKVVPTGGTGYQVGDVVYVAHPTAANYGILVEITGVAAGVPAATGCVVLTTSPAAFTAVANPTVFLGTMNNHAAAGTAGVVLTGNATNGAIVVATGGITATVPAALGGAGLGTLGTGAVTNSVSTTAVYLSTYGTPGIMAGDVLTVVNTNNANVNSFLYNGTTKGTNGTILVTSVDDTTGAITGSVLSAGSGYSPGAAGGVYPVVSNTSYARITTGSAGLTAYQPGIPADFSSSTTLGTNTRDSLSSDVKRYGGPQQDAVTVLGAAGANATAFSRLTYSIETAAACGTAASQTYGHALLMTGQLGSVVYPVKKATDNTNNVVGFDYEGAAFICDMTSASMFGWANGSASIPAGGTAVNVAGPFSGGYGVADSTSGTAMVIRLDINVVDFEGNTFKAADVDYNVH